MKFVEIKIKGVIIVEPKVFEDHRGFFMESYKRSVYKEAGFPDFVQDNQSRSTKGVLRGLHYQLSSHPMGKLVRCLRGEIFDVGVDLRKGSPTYGKWVGEVLTEKKRNMLYFPSGFAHGFLTLSDVCEVFYKCTAEYNKESERALFWNDPKVGIKWPKIGMEPILSEKDRQNPLFDKVETDYIF